MGYTKHGFFRYDNIYYTDSTWTKFDYEDDVERTYTNLNNALYITIRSVINGSDRTDYYYLHAYPLTDESKQQTETIKHIFKDKNGVITKTSSDSNILNLYPGSNSILTNFPPNKTIIENRSVSTNIPIFKYDDTESINNYINNGDDSGKIKFLNTDWVLYIDGKSNPLYKLTWNCSGLKDIDTSFTTISIWVGTYNVFDDTFNDDDGTKFKNIDYDKYTYIFENESIYKAYNRQPK